MQDRIFLILCAERSHDRISRVGGYFEDDGRWYDFSGEEVVDLVNDERIVFFTKGDDGTFAQVHTVHRAKANYIQTNPDGSLSDNLDHLHGCGDFARLVTRISDEDENEVLQRFRTWYQGQVAERRA